MEIFSECQARRKANAKHLSAFGASVPAAGSNGLYRTIREGGPIAITTVGYERRDGEDLISALRDAGVEYLADIRDKPISRKPDFRAAALQAFCESAGLEYGPWSQLGSTQSQRDALKESGDIARFHRNFRAYALRNLGDPLDRLARIAQRKSVALLCYERAHEDCHRSTIADLLGDRLNATITAIC